MPEQITILDEENTEETVVVSISGATIEPVYISIDEVSPPVFAVNGRQGYIILDKSDVGLSNVEDISIIAVSGYLQNQLDNLDSGYATDADLSIVSGNLVASGSSLVGLINSLSGYSTSADIAASGYFENMISSLSGALNSSGSYLIYQIDGLSDLLGVSSGSLQAQIDDISNYGYITGFDSGNYVLKSETGVFVTRSESGQFYPASNPDGFIDQSALLPYLTGFDSGNYVQKSETGIFALSSDLNATELYLGGLIGTSSGTLQGQLDNLDNLYATDSQLTGLSGQLVVQIGQTGATLQNQINNLYNSGFITGFDSGSYVLKSETGVFALSSNVAQSGVTLTNLIGAASGTLQSQINNLDSGYASQTELNAVSGSVNTVSGLLTNYYLKSNPSGFITGFASGNYVLKSETGIFATQSSLVSSGSSLSASISSLSGSLNSTGSNLQSQINNITAVSGDFVTRAESGRFYPANNPSGFLTGVDLTNYVIKSETGVFALSSTLYSSGELLYGRDSQVSGALNETGLYLNNKIVNLTSLFTGYTGIASDNRFVNITGDVMSGRLALPSLSVLDSGFVQFSTGTPSWNEGRVFYDWDTHSVSFYNDQSDMTVNLSQEQLVRVSNGWTGTIPNGMVVLVSGSQGNRPRVIPASSLAGYISDHDVLGMATHDIETVGYITTQGVVNGLNTSIYDEGTLLYLSTSGGSITDIAPTPPNHTVKVGIVIRQHANQGAIFVKINNGEHLGDLHDVYVTSPQNGDYLTYNTGSGIWVNSVLNTGNFASAYSLNQTGVYLDNKIDSLSGYAVNNFALQSNLTATGVNLQQQLNDMKILAIAYAIAL